MFDVTANSLAPGFPRKITAVFPAVTSGDHPGGNIDAAYFSYTHNAVFLFKDTQFWRVVGRSRDRWRRPSLPRNGLLPRRKVEEQWFDICNVHSSALKVARRWEGGLWGNCGIRGSWTEIGLHSYQLQTWHWVRSTDWPCGYDNRVPKVTAGWLGIWLIFYYIIRCISLQHISFIMITIVNYYQPYTCQQYIFSCFKDIVVILIVYT